MTLDNSDTLTGVTINNGGQIDLSAFEPTAPVENSGSITGRITLTTGIPLINDDTGTISGAGLAVIEGVNGPAELQNWGVIDPATYGVDFTSGGSVTNMAGATIEGTLIGVLITGGAGTVTNGGTIIGDSGDAGGRLRQSGDPATRGDVHRSGRWRQHDRRLHGAIDLETGQTIMKDVLSVDALSTILLSTAIETLYPGIRLIHVFLDNARYHHAKLVQAWLLRPERRIRLHFAPTYCPHPRSASRLEPIERLWGLMHRHTTHNKCYATFKEFSGSLLTFLRQDVPANWREWCDQVTDNFRIINPTEFRIIG